MRMNRMSAGLLFALGCALSACGGADQGVDDSQESLRRGQAADGGSRAHRDSDKDSDEDAEEALAGDGGKQHDHDRDDVDGRSGDGGCDFDRGGRGGKDDRGSKDDNGGKGGKGERGDAGKRGFPFSFDAGTP